jgi:hypothetical protein
VRRSRSALVALVLILFGMPLCVPLVDVTRSVGARKPVVAVGRSHPRAVGKDDAVAVVCEVRYYAVGLGVMADPDDGPGQLFERPDPKQTWLVSGIVLEILEPAEHAGQILTMHHDGVLASGDPFKLWERGKRYQFKVGRGSIGKFDFALCSLGGSRKVVGRR